MFDGMIGAFRPQVKQVDFLFPLRLLRNMSTWRLSNVCIGNAYCLVLPEILSLQGLPGVRPSKQMQLTAVNTWGRRLQEMRAASLPTKKKK